MHLLPGVDAPGLQRARGEGLDGCPGCPEICADGTYGAPGEGCSERCD